MDDDVKRRCEKALRQSAKTLAAADRLLARLLAIYGRASDDGRQSAPAGDAAKTNQSKTRRRRT
jgi:hypothetical protein